MIINNNNDNNNNNNNNIIKNVNSSTNLHLQLKVLTLFLLVAQQLAVQTLKSVTIQVLTILCAELSTGHEN